MKISSINFGTNSAEKACFAMDFIPTTLRHNSLSDIDFNIISDKIKCQNLKNQMRVRLLNLKQSFSNTMLPNLCN